MAGRSCWGRTMFISSGMAIFLATLRSRSCRTSLMALEARSTSIPNTTYGDASGNIANTATMAGALFDNYSQGTALTHTTFTNVISRAIEFRYVSRGSQWNLFYPHLTGCDLEFPPHPTAAHKVFVLLSAGSIPPARLGRSTHDIKVAFVGDPATQCPRRPNANTCSSQSSQPQWQ